MASSAVRAQSAPLFTLPPAERQAVRDVERYINDIDTLVADFTQTSPDGTVGYGRLFLKRPGKIRWQYEPPIPLLIVVNGPVLVYQDFELDQVSHLSSDQNLMALLARDNLQFGRDVVVQEVEVSSGTIRMTIESPAEEDDGTLTLIMQADPVEIRKLEVRDPTGQLTIISLNNLRYGQSLQNDLFEVETLNRSRRRN